MNNFEKWKYYTSALPSPDNYIKWSWYYIIAASLQRRVWMGSKHRALYPNMYVILTGPPGVGKGLILKEVGFFIRYWTLDMAETNTKLAKSTDDKALLEAAKESHVKNATEVPASNHGKQREIHKPLLIPVAPDSITSESLVKTIAENYRYVNWVEEMPDGKRNMRAYGHSSVCFVLPELSSLLKKNTNNTVNFLLSAFDCPDDHDCSTISRGNDRIKRGCLSLIAGTTPSFMQTTFDEDLVGEGFTSRTSCIYATKNRFNAWSLPGFTPEQLVIQKELLDHIKKLTALHGEIKVSDEAEAWLSIWWDEYNKKGFCNKSPEMIPYYARKNIHVKKLAIAKWFSDHAEGDDCGRPVGEIPLSIFKEVIGELEEEEKNMHLALILEGKTAESKASQKIMSMLHARPHNFVDMFVACHKIVGRQELEQALEFLTITNQIATETVKDETTGEDTIIYRKL